MQKIRECIDIRIACRLVLSRKQLEIEIKFMLIIILDKSAISEYTVYVNTITV